MGNQEKESLNVWKSMEIPRWLITFHIICDTPCVFNFLSWVSVYLAYKSIYFTAPRQSKTSNMITLSLQKHYLPSKCPRNDILLNSSTHIHIFVLPSLVLLKRSVSSWAVKKCSGNANFSFILCLRFLKTIRLVYVMRVNWWWSALCVFWTEELSNNLLRIVYVKFTLLTW